MSESLLSAGTEPTVAATTTTAAAAPEGSLLTGATAATQQPGTAEGTPPAEGTAPNAEGKPATTEAVVEGAPEAYTDFTLPEGVALDADSATEIKGLAKELNLSQEKAQKVVDAATKLAQKGTQQIADTIRTVHEQWQAETRADKEIGGDKLTENLAKAKAAMQATSTPQLQVLLDKSGLGNHPEVIRHFLKIAPAFTEDKHVTGGKAPPGDSRSAAKVLYPNNA